MVLSRVRLIRVRLVLVNLNPINDTYINNKMSQSNITFITVQNKSVLVLLCFVLRLFIVCLYMCVCECLLQNNNHKTRPKNSSPSKKHSCVRSPLQECRSIRSGASGFLLLHTTCMRLWCSGVASCVVA